MKLETHEKDTILNWISQEKEITEDQFSNKENYEDYINRVKIIEEKILQDENKIYVITIKCNSITSENKTIIFTDKDKAQKYFEECLDLDYNQIVENIGNLEIEESISNYVYEDYSDFHDVIDNFKLNALKDKVYTFFDEESGDTEVRICEVDLNLITNEKYL